MSHSARTAHKSIDLLYHERKTFIVVIIILFGRVLKWATSVSKMMTRANILSIWNEH